MAKPTNMITLKRVLAGAVMLALVASVPAGADTKMKRLGEDPAGDGYPALDLTYVDVGQTGDDLEIRIGVDLMLPVLSGWPELPGIEWQFDTGKRKFLAEAFIRGAGNGNYLLFENKDGVYEQMGAIEGTYNWADGYLSMLVPLHHIDGRKGMKIRGIGDDDADAHVHTGVNTIYTDYLTTTKAFKLR